MMFGGVLWVERGVYCKSAQGDLVVGTWSCVE